MKHPRFRYKPGTHALDTVWGVAVQLTPGRFFVGPYSAVTKVFEVRLSLSIGNNIIVACTLYNHRRMEHTLIKFKADDKVEMYIP